MKDNMDSLLKQALTPTENADSKLNQRILQKAKEQGTMKNTTKKIRRIPAVAAACLAVIVVGSVGVYASYRFLTPDHVAESVENTKLADAFSSDSAISINETQTYGDLEVTLLGIVSGDSISDYALEAGGVVKTDRTYAVTAISKADGTEITTEESESMDYFVSPLMQNYDPNRYNIFTMNGGYSQFLDQGVLYRLVECDNIEKFAGHTIYLCVGDGTFFNGDAYCYNDKTGEITRNEDYAGMNALFTLPIDSSLGDETAVAEYLKSMEEEALSTEESDTELSEEAELYNKLTPENIDQYAAPIESTVQTLTPDENGDISYSYELPDGASGSGSINVVEVFQNPNDYYSFSYEVTDMVLFGYSCSDGETEKTMLIDTFRLNEDGSVTYTVYKGILE